MTEHVVTIVGFMILLVSSTYGQDAVRSAPATPTTQPAIASQPATAPSGPVSAPTTQPIPALQTPTSMPSLLPSVPVYGGDLWGREYLTGDWRGARQTLADNGVLFQGDLTQTLQGNAYGGKDTTNAFRYSGAVEYKLTFDTARLKLWPGGLFVLKGETQIGDNINSKVGSLLVPNYQGMLPVPGEPGITTLSEFYFMQMLSEQLMAVAGKMDLTALGDQNTFAGDQRTQFMNVGLRVNPVLFYSAPYTAMSAGLVWYPTKWLQVSTLVADNDPDGAATRTGFNTAFHGREWMTVMQEYDLTIKPFDLTGHQRFGWFWTSRDFPEIGGLTQIQFPELVVRRLLARRFVPRPLRLASIAGRAVTFTGLDTSADTWGIYYNFDQFLFTEADDPNQGLGIFGRFGVGAEPNLFEHFYSFGVGGKGSIPTRDRDTWGVGYYCAAVSDSISPVFDMSSEQGVELYYNIEITPWLHISPDLQVIVNPGGGFGDREPAIVYGLRTQMSL